MATIGQSIGTGADWLMWIIVGLFVLFVVFGGIGWFYWNKKRWNIKVEFKIPRSDGRTVNAEWGKGFYNARKGIVYLKRKGIMRKIAMRPFKISKYLQGTNFLTVVQISPLIYEPILPSSFTKFINDKTGKEVYLLELHADLNTNKGWATYAERSGKATFSIASMLQQYQVPISIAIVLISVFLGFAIIWGRLPSICG